MYVFELLVVIAMCHPHRKSALSSPSIKNIVKTNRHRKKIKIIKRDTQIKEYPLFFNVS